MALLEIPSLGVKEVVGEGTTGPVLMSGPGHLRSTVFPGGVGSSVIFGRAATYGGPFAHIHELHRGAQIKVTTAVGTSTFRVVDTRYAGDVVPPLASGQARLTLATATTSFFVPSGVVWVDADLVGSPLPAASPAAAVPTSERPLGVDTGTSVLGALALWLAVLVCVLAAAVWMWHRRGRVQAWIIFSAPVAVVAYFVAGHASALLPNLM
jgi:LPXTG-site transpeptidase (sortase) family protein